MTLIGGETNVFGLDIGSTGIRVVQLRGANPPKSLITYGAVAIDPKIVMSDAQTDRQRLGEIIRKLLEDSRISTNNVVAGLPSNKVFSSVVDMPKLSKQEMDQSIKYQAEQYIPMPLDKVKLDWVVLGDSPNGSGNQEVLLVAAPNSYTESQLELLESMGLNVDSIEPDTVALMRALVPQTTTGAIMLMDVGAHSSDITIVYNGAPRVIRSIAIGGESLIKSAAQNLNIDVKQAAQFVSKFGLAEGKLEGQVFKALKPSVDNLVEEVGKSTKFFYARYPQVKIEKVVVSGGASRLPHFPLYLANAITMPVEIGNSWTNVSYDPTLQDTLLSISSQFSVAVGLALRYQS